METYTPDVPLSAEEEAAWRLMVSNGSAIRAPIIEAQAEKVEAYKKRVGSNKEPWWVSAKGNRRDSMKEIPLKAKRWVIFRMAGMSFRKAGEASGANWLMIQDARARSEEFRCALAAQEDNSRQLMVAKARSVIEQSQEEDSKVSIAQTQVSMKILECLDRAHFGEMTGSVSEDAKAAAIGGGFVINLIGDAAKKADSAPAKKPERALVYTDV